MADEDLNLFKECAARCVYLFPQEEECTWADCKIYLSGTLANSQRKPTDRNNDTFAKIRICFLVRNHSMQGWIATTRYGVTGKRSTKRLKHTENHFRKNLQLISVC